MFPNVGNQPTNDCIWTNLLRAHAARLLYQPPPSFWMNTPRSWMHQQQFPFPFVPFLVRNTSEMPETTTIKPPNNQSRNKPLIIEKRKTGDNQGQATSSTTASSFSSSSCSSPNSITMAIFEGNDTHRPHSMRWNLEGASKIDLINDDEKKSEIESLCLPKGVSIIVCQINNDLHHVIFSTKRSGFREGETLAKDSSSGENRHSWLQFCRKSAGKANVDPISGRFTAAIGYGQEILAPVQMTAKQRPIESQSVVSFDVVSKCDEPARSSFSLHNGFDIHLNAEGESMSSATSGEGFACERCGKMFSYSYYRDKHLKYTRCVDRGDRKFPCALCSRSFEKRDRLRIHVLHVHENHRPHCCSVCGKRFSQSSSLNKHLRVHSGERPYKCSFCAKAFTASSILRTHVRQHSGEKPFKCKHCGKAFASHAAHDSHVRRSHVQMQEKLANDLFSCNQCGCVANRCNQEEECHTNDPLCQEFPCNIMCDCVKGGCISRDGCTGGGNEICSSAACLAMCENTGSGHTPASHR